MIKCNLNDGNNVRQVLDWKLKYGTTETEEFFSKSFYGTGAPRAIMNRKMMLRMKVLVKQP